MGKYPKKMKIPNLSFKDIYSQSKAPAKSVDLDYYFVYIKGEDKTSQIATLKRGENVWWVTFRSNRKKAYHFSLSDIKLKDRQKVLKRMEKRKKFVDAFKKPPSKPTNSSSQGNGQNHAFNSPKAPDKTTPTAQDQRPKEKENRLKCRTRSQEAFEYLKKLANKLPNSGGSSQNQEGAEPGFLARQYNKLYTNQKNTLALYLDPQTPQKIAQDKIDLIFPFSFNLSQIQATRNGLGYNLSVIEGPPGTGKTQTILNMIANILLQRKTVAVVSCNNSATQNVYDKLVANDLGWIAAYLGNQANKDAFINDQPKYPDAWDDIIQKDEAKEYKAKLIQQTHNLEQALELKNRLAQYQQEYRELSREKHHFDADFAHQIEPAKYKKYHPKQASDILALSVRLEFSQKRKPSLLFKLKNLHRFGFSSLTLYKHNISEVITFLQSEYYSRRLKELSASIKSTTAKLVSFQDNMQDLARDAMRYFKSYLYYKYDFSSDRKLFNQDFIKGDFDSFIQEYPVVLSTTHALRSSTQKGYMYDYLIIDEASQVDIVSGGLALSCAKNTIVVGDTKQLPPVITPAVQSALASMPTHEFLNYNDSLLVSMVNAFEPYNLPRTLLREHYRCHPKIIDFCNKKFYNNQLIILTKDDTEQNPLVLFHTTEGNHQRGAKSQREIDIIKYEILDKIPDTDTSSKGIVAPFREQVRSAAGQVDSSLDIEVDTVHKYQGREKDIMILTTVVSQQSSFADDPNLLNVAISRAVKKLYVVTSGNRENPNIRDLIRYMEYQSLPITDSRVYSIFDLLYKQYAPEMNRFSEKLRGSKKISQYDSENLMKICIEEVLTGEKFSNLAWTCHYQLRKLIKDMSMLQSDREVQFVSNPWTHVDFIFYNKWNKQPLLALEVDGVAFHKQEKQQERDRIKNSVLERYGIPLIRFSTDGSREHERLREALEQVLIDASV